MLTKSFDYRLHQFALGATALGAIVGITATIFSWLTRGEFSTTTFFASLFAITAAAPVWHKYRDMS